MKVNNGANPITPERVTAAVDRLRGVPIFRWLDIRTRTGAFIDACLFPSFFVYIRTLYEHINANLVLRLHPCTRKTPKHKSPPEDWFGTTYVVLLRTTPS